MSAGNTSAAPPDSTPRVVVVQGECANVRSFSRAKKAKTVYQLVREAGGWAYSSRYRRGELLCVGWDAEGWLVVSEGMLQGIWGWVVRCWVVGWFCGAARSGCTALGVLGPRQAWLFTHVTPGHVGLQQLRAPCRLRLRSERSSCCCGEGACCMH
jgi:hypothetical protein